MMMISNELGPVHLPNVSHTSTQPDCSDRGLVGRLHVRSGMCTTLLRSTGLCERSGDVLCIFAKSLSILKWNDLHSGKRARRHIIGSVFLISNTLPLPSHKLEKNLRIERLNKTHAHTHAQQVEQHMSHARK